MNLGLAPGLAGIRRPLIGMLHLPALPGSPDFGGDIKAAQAAMIRDAQSLQTGGAHAFLLENFGDAPFFPGQVPAITVAHMALFASRLRRETDLPFGINVLRNDASSALAVAHASGASFIRVNVLAGARVTDQGLVEGRAHELLREREALGAREIRIFADVHVKHSAPVAERSLEDEAADLVQRAGADAIIVTGSGTGRPVAPAELRKVRAVCADRPLLVGSGVTLETAPKLARHADGFIVGSALKRDADPRQPVDTERVRSLVAALAR